MEQTDHFYDEKYYKEHYGKLYDPGYYQKISRFWKYNIFDANNFALDGKLLDFGAGLGQISASLEADCFDPSPVATQFLKRQGRVIYQHTDKIPLGYYKYLLSSHALEHALKPFEQLFIFKKILVSDGYLILILPAEDIPGRPVKRQDDNKHFYCWNFQTITNLLIESGFEIVQQKMIYGPVGLTKTDNFNLVHQLGKLWKHYPSILTIAKII